MKRITIRRNIRNCPQRAKTQAYNTFVRPSLEYASTVWDPHTQANINKVESIQRRAARFVTNNYDPRASVTTLLQDLNWPTLQHRRQLAKLIMMYRITYHLIKISYSCNYYYFYYNNMIFIFKILFTFLLQKFKLLFCLIEMNR